jgi:beta-lactamase superfamily II metal-dependent hydrolase
MRNAIALFFLTWCAASAVAQPIRGLDIYFIDTEGGAATLIVTPAGESVLIDSGNPGKRDAERIHKTATELAKLKAIDHHIVTHWHLDHYGGIERLVQLMPIHRYYHHGIPETLAEDPKNFPTLIKAFKQVSSGKEQRLQPGDTLALKQTSGSPKLEILCVCGHGDVMADKPGAPENAIAKDHQPKPEDKSDNARSLGFVLQYGGFRFLDLGDLTWNIEHKLVHPTDKLGKVDLYQATHHGLEISNNPVLIRTVQPRVVVFNNGPRKGGHAQVLGTLRRLPDPPAIFQLHRNVALNALENTEAERIANNEEKDCKGIGIRAAVAADGKSYSIIVGENGKPQQFQTRNP